MAKAQRTDLTWQDVDVDGFKGPMKKAYEAMKEANVAAREARDTFDNAFRKAAGGKFGAGNSCLISHRFGKMSIAVVPEGDVSKEGRKVSGEKFAL